MDRNQGGKPRKAGGSTHNPRGDNGTGNNGGSRGRAAGGPRGRAADGPRGRAADGPRGRGAGGARGRLAGEPMSGTASDSTSDGDLLSDSSGNSRVYGKSKTGGYGHTSDSTSGNESARGFSGYPRGPGKPKTGGAVYTSDSTSGNESARGYYGKSRGFDKYQTGGGKGSGSRSDGEFWRGPSGNPRGHTMPRTGGNGIGSESKSDGEFWRGPYKNSRDVEKNRQNEATDTQQYEKADLTTPKAKPVRKGLFNVEDIEVNLLPVKLSNLPGEVYQYSIAFSQEITVNNKTKRLELPKKFKQDAFTAFIEKYFTGWKEMVAFDGAKIFYAVEALPKQPYNNMKFTFEKNGGKEIFCSATVNEKVTVVDLKTIKNLSETEIGLESAKQCLEIVLWASCNIPGLTRIKRAVFDPKKGEVKNFCDDGHYKLMAGLTQSLIIGSKVYLNVDVTYKGFPNDSINKEELKKIAKRKNGNELKGWKFIYTSPKVGTYPAEYKCKYFVDRADKEMTDIGEGETKIEMTVADYFKNEVGRELKHKEDPVCIVGRIKKLKLPIEHIAVAPLQDTTIPDFYASKIPTAAASLPAERKQRIMDLLESINHYQHRVINNFGIEVDCAFATVTSHVLNSRTIRYANGPPVNVNQGQWKISKSTKFQEQPKGVISWGILHYGHNENRVKSFAEMIFNKSKLRGIPLASLKETKIETYNDSILKKKLESFKSLKTKLLIVVIAKRFQYPLVKQLAELECGILTQCVLGFNVNKDNNDTIVENIVLKLNAKLNGINHSVEADATVGTPAFGKNWMAIGADVTHPSPMEKNIPSIVGAVASFDANGFKYYPQCRFQASKDEIIQDLESIVFEQIGQFRKEKKCLPELILYYRDGVSDGEFETVTRVELCAMKKACHKQGILEPKITIILVQKRHHIRFFPKDKNSSNVVPGTVVDSEIVNRFIETFYMVSHQPMQGTAKPTKYCVLHDDSNIPPEEIQVFTYDLCHMFARCNRVVSYPAPTYYAHLMAARARLYVDKQYESEYKLKSKYETILKNVIDNNPMFFV